MQRAATRRRLPRWTAVSLPDAWTPTYLAAAYGQLGRLAEAQVQVAKFQKQHPGMTMLHYAAHEPYRESADLEHLLEGVRKANSTAPSRP